MKPGALGEFIPEHGHFGVFAWESWGRESRVYRVMGGQLSFIAAFFGEKAIRLERVASFIGYLEDERKA